MSSLYGSGQAQASQTAAVADASVQQVSATETASTTASDPLTDSKNIEAYVRSAYAGEPLLVDIARCESTFRQYDANGQVLRGKANPEDVGVMQINEHYHADEAVAQGDNIYTLQGNVAFAKYLYDKYGAQPWSSSSSCWDGSSELADK